MSDENDAPDAGTMDAIRAALAEEARGLADSRTFKPAYVWQVVAAALPEIDRIVTASKGRGKGATKAVYDDIATKLRAASGFDELSGESVRQYRSRLLGGDYDTKLAALGFRRVDNRIVAVADLPTVGDAPRNNVAVPLLSVDGPQTDNAAGVSVSSPSMLLSTDQNSCPAPDEAADGEQSKGGGIGSVPASPEVSGLAPGFAFKADPKLKRNQA